MLKYSKITVWKDLVLSGPNNFGLGQTSLHYWILLLDPNFFWSSPENVGLVQNKFGPNYKDKALDEALEPVVVELRNKVQNDFCEYRINIYLLIVQTALKTDQFSCQL